MTLEALAIKVVEAAEAAGVEFMAVGAIAAGAYGVPRSTRDVDLLVAVNVAGGVDAVVKALEPWVQFNAQVVFDTLTWGRRHVGRSRFDPPFKVELFELFDDPFVQSEFRRRVEVFVPMLARATWLPTPEDVVVQKLRWGRNKDLDDARDVLAVQGPETLDMAYIEGWCAQHGTTARLRAALAGIPPL
ncbi:hypothetical protein LBMAG56_15140 [Verrucomicrobiota bacterium]|nr:hypothetical protein LBMAG56_15140 [Verrucomicrobiota bacterium]